MQFCPVPSILWRVKGNDAFVPKFHNDKIFVSVDHKDKFVLINGH